jgi:16S rRNA (uracil1498-N3)-methyltransferase
MTSAPKIRLFVEGDLSAGEINTPRDEQAHYLRRVMRLGDGDEVAVFNGRDGEWRAVLRFDGSRRCKLAPSERLRAQQIVPDVCLGFAPVKRPHIDLIVTKATELGAARLAPVLTDFTVVDRVNARRLRANAVEAAEQCGRIEVPVLDEPVPLERFLAGLDGRPLLWADEGGEGQPMAALLNSAATPPVALLVGPEGGFSAAERARLHDLDGAHAVSLGPRTLRAETAAIAMLVLWQALAGDWRPGK